MRMEPVTDTCVWTGTELKDDRSWEYVLTNAHRSELVAALGAVKKRGLGIPVLAKETLRAQIFLRTQLLTSNFVVANTKQAINFSSPVFVFTRIQFAESWIE